MDTGDQYGDERDGLGRIQGETVRRGFPLAGDVAVRPGEAMLSGQNVHEERLPDGTIVRDIGSGHNVARAVVTPGGYAEIQGLPSEDAPLYSARQNVREATLAATEPAGSTRRDVPGAVQRSLDASGTDSEQLREQLVEARKKLFEQLSNEILNPDGRPVDRALQTRARVEFDRMTPLWQAQTPQDIQAVFQAHPDFARRLIDSSPEGRAFTAAAYTVSLHGDTHRTLGGVREALDNREEWVRGDVGDAVMAAFATVDAYSPHRRSIVRAAAADPEKRIDALRPDWLPEIMALREKNRGFSEARSLPGEQEKDARFREGSRADQGPLR